MLISKHSLTNEVLYRAFFKYITWSKKHFYPDTMTLVYWKGTNGREEKCYNICPTDGHPELLGKK